jgi:alkyldihydroxyacetonephosphate synthase
LAITGGADAAATTAGRFGGEPAPIAPDVLARLRSACPEVDTDPAAVADASRDWWPLGLVWATEGRAPARAAVRCRPSSVDEVAAVLRVCNEARVPVTPAGGRSGVCGGSVPVHGGVLLDLTRLAGVDSVDHESLVVDVGAGTFGDHLEATLRADHGLTLGHHPQSISLSTVGGWLATRSAGQLSNRYGKIEDLVVGLDVVLASGRRLATGGHARASTGPDLTQLFVGSEGTLGVITGARLRLRPLPTSAARAAYGLPSFEAGLAACRQLVQRGGQVAVARLYDTVESARNFDVGDAHVLLLYDEGEARLVDAAMALAAEACDRHGASPLDAGLVDRWLGHRNDVSSLASLVQAGFVVDTIEVTASWRALGAVYVDALAALRAVEHCMVASAHQSHAYPDGACLYFTFAGRPPTEQREAFYRAAWDAATHAILDRGGSLSHHHGVGLNRSRFVARALGPQLGVLAAIKAQLDPHGILNPGKAGLPSPFGAVGW